jgi:hypothetical protein
MSKKFPVLWLFVVVSSLAVIAHKPVFAEPDIVSGVYRETSATDAGQWMVKYLGGLNNIDDPSNPINETFAWENERSYVNGALDSTGYAGVVAIDNAMATGLGWVTTLPWIGVDYEHDPGLAEAGYYSYVTTINDTAITSADPTAEFKGLTVSFTGDDHMHAVVINGVIYDGFQAQDHTYSAWMEGYTDLFILPGDGIPWNLNGSNTVEFIVHNSGWNFNQMNYSGLSASIQASYTSAVPEPSVVLMFSAGLLVLPLARRLRKT